MSAGLMSFLFEADPVQELTLLGDAAPVYVGGKETLEKKPNWRESVDINFVWDRQPIDYGYGAIGSPVDFKFPARITKATYLARDRMEGWDIINFFNRHQGQRLSFFTPTFEDDIPYSAISGGGLAILIKGTAFAYTYMDNTVYRRIVLRLADGSYSYHLVDFIEALPSGDSVLWVTEALPVLALNRETVRGISWCLSSRFATDELVMTFPSNTVAEFSLAIRSLENFEI